MSVWRLTKSTCAACAQLLYPVANTTVARKAAARERVSTHPLQKSATPAATAYVAFKDVRRVRRLDKPAHSRRKVDAAHKQGIAGRVCNTAQIAKGLKLTPVAPADSCGGAQPIERPKCACD